MGQDLSEVKILVPGCGDSLMSEQMASEFKCLNVKSVDFEEDTLKRMQERQSEPQKQGRLEYEQMDITEMSYKDDTYDAVVDKALLDAICTDGGVLTMIKVTKYFEEVKRVLKRKGGQFLIVSLLQDFVLDAILAHFSGEKQIDVDPIIQTDWQKKSKLVPFLVTVYIDKDQEKTEEEKKKSEIRVALEFKEKVKQAQIELSIG